LGGFFKASMGEGSVRRFENYIGHRAFLSLSFDDVHPIWKEIRFDERSDVSCVVAV
jgi:hypothetical protein